MCDLGRKTPCSECPFRRDSIPGYLGASNPVEFLQTTETGIEMPCHMGIDYEKKDWAEKQLPTADQCAGSLIYLANNGKMPYPYPDVMTDDQVRQVEATVERIPQVEPDREKVFQWPHEFLLHHSRGRIAGMFGQPPTERQKADYEKKRGK